MFHVSREFSPRLAIKSGPPPASPETTDMPIVRLLQSLRAEAVRWQADARCIGVDPDLFFPERGASSAEAKSVCRGCPVRVECLGYAIANGEKFGIWGGYSPPERRRMGRPR